MKKDQLILKPEDFNVFNGSVNVIYEGTFCWMISKYVTIMFLLILLSVC